jgi:hypothetical protein
MRRLEVSERPLKQVSQCKANRGQDLSDLAATKVVHEDSTVLELAH